MKHFDGDRAQTTAFMGKDTEDEIDSMYTLWIDLASLGCF